MRISDWSSDVCSSDLGRRFQCDRCRHLRHRLSKRSRKPLAAGLTHQSEGPPARFPHVTQRETFLPKALSQNLETIAALQSFCVFGYQTEDLLPAVADAGYFEIGRAHVCTRVTNAHLVYRLRLDKQNTQPYHSS